MVPRQWLVSCHRRRASAEAHQCLKPTRHAPHAAMAAATLAVAASAALDHRPPWSGTIRQATGQLVLACQMTPRQQKKRTVERRWILVIALLNPTLQHRDYFQSLKCPKHRSALRLPPVARIQGLVNFFWIYAAVPRRAFLTLGVVLSKAIL